MTILTIKDDVTGAIAPGQDPETGLPIAPVTPPAELSGEAKALADTKAALTKAQQELAELKKAAAPPAEKPAVGDGGATDEAAKTAEGKQLEITDEQVQKVQAMDFAEWQEEFTQTLDVSEEGRTKIAEKVKGVFGEHARQLVDDYIEGAKVRTNNAVNDMMEVAGGREQYVEMVGWAKENLNRADKIAFNNAVNSRDHAAANLAIAGLRHKYEANTNRAPNLLGGGGGGDGGVYKSTAEMQKDMGDPRYKKDPAFRQAVQDKLVRSDIL